MPDRFNERTSKDLLKDTPLKTEGFNEQREREDAHRSIEPIERQPFMVCYMGMLDYGVLWIGKPGFISETESEHRKREQIAERDLEWWAKHIDNGLQILPFSRRPSRHDLMVRQQWDLDALVEAIQRGYDNR
jgi:hypothetical protein